MSIVVTGAAGFLGATLLPALEDAGHRTVGIDRLPAASVAPTSVAPTSVAPTMHLACELTEATTEVLATLGDAEAVIHLAGCPGVRDSAPDVAMRRQRDNVEAARAVLEATPLDTPVIVVSSSSVYGGAQRDPDHPRQHLWARHNNMSHLQAHHGVGDLHSFSDLRPSREDDQLAPRGGYAASKVAAEHICRARAAAGGHILVVRPFTVLGEGQRADMAVARWAHEARATGGVTVLGSSRRTRDFTDVRDVARALIALLHSGATGTVNIGTGQGHSLADLAEAVCRAVGVPAHLHRAPAASSEVPHTCADTERLLALIGFVPQTDLTDVVARSIHSIDQRAAHGRFLVGA